MRFGEVAREQLNGCSDVLDVRHFVDRVHVTGGNGKRDDRNTGSGALESASIGTPTREDFELVADTLTLGDLAQVLEKRPAGEMGRIENLESDTCSERGDTILGVDARNVTGDGDIQRDPDVGFEPERCGLSAA